MNGPLLIEMYQIIEALMIIHNMLEEFGDPATIQCFNGPEDDNVELVRGEAPDHIMLIWMQMTCISLAYFIRNSYLT